MSFEDSTPDPETSGPLSDQLRNVTDAQTMRALAHPVRIELLEALGLHGPMTATQVGDVIGESATTCSFHLRQLAKYGFVEEAGGGKGRSRPWKASMTGMRLSAVQDDPATAVAAGALTKMIRDRQLRRYQNWLDNSSSYPVEWREAADDGEFLVYLTAPELKELGHDISELMLSRFRDRATDPTQRPAGSLPVEILYMSFPITAPPKDDQS